MIKIRSMICPICGQKILCSVFLFHNIKRETKKINFLIAVAVVIVVRVSR